MEAFKNHLQKFVPIGKDNFGEIISFFRVGISQRFILILSNVSLNTCWLLFWAFLLNISAKSRKKCVLKPV